MAKVKATIQEIQINKLKKLAVVSVKFQEGTQSWNKALGLKLTEGRIKWGDFKAKLEELYNESGTLDNALKEIKEKEGVEFELFGGK